MKVIKLQQKHIEVTCLQFSILLTKQIYWKSRIFSGAPEPRGQRGQLPPLPKQCGGSTGAAGCLFFLPELHFERRAFFT